MSLAILRESSAIIYFIFFDFHIRMGYLLLPEETTEVLNDAFLNYSLAMNRSTTFDKPSISNPLFIFDNPMLEILTGDILIESALHPTEETLASINTQKTSQDSDEIEYKVEINFDALQEEYAMIGIEMEQNNIDQISSIGQYLYEVTIDDETKYITKCATVDDNLYIALTDTGTVYSIDKSCIVRKQNDRRLEEV
ncbi:hypothetical protein NEIG_00864 [Nematocida sp. ERTm5]|nr:hypothetical protein NEIG_00864 [Nematocida sp. ERTm5]